MNAHFKGLKDDGKYQTATILFTHAEDRNWNFYVSLEQAKEYKDCGFYLSDPLKYDPDINMEEFWDDAWKTAKENYDRSHALT